ncbi:hypothetical protein ACFWMS_26435 [Peribacillus butanolivorans]|uniref:hypothetical protein n=1 Tax=Peribacillus butanolivorans TaxID=421767 RepID=UPI003668A8EE
MKKKFMGVLAVAGLVLTGCGSSEQSGPSAEEIAAQNMTKSCHEKVADKLKSPGTAQFGDVKIAEFDGSPYTHLISGWVDAQNSFGALVRADYECKSYAKEDGEASSYVRDFTQRK